MKIEEIFKELSNSNINTAFVKLQDMGIDIRDKNGSFRSMTDMINELVCKCNEVDEEVIKYINDEV